MLPDGTYTAVIDRIEDELATLEVAAGDELNSLTVDESDLPAEARSADTVLTVTVEDGTLVTVEYDDTATTERASDAQRRFDRLSKRPPRDEDDDS